MNCIDLFAGCGGFSAGFRDAGFVVLGANEIWEPAAQTYARNHSGTALVVGDIRTHKEALYAAIGDAPINCVFGGPPCQGYSLAGNRDPLDPCGRLYEEFVDVVAHTRPDAFVLENVKGLLSMKYFHPDPSHFEREEVRIALEALAQIKALKRIRAQRALTPEEEGTYTTLVATRAILLRQIDARLSPLLDQIIEQFRRLGYVVIAQTLNAADYGCPQTRERVFVVGTRDRPFPFPPPSHRGNWVSARTALADLEDTPENRGASHIFTRHSPEMVSRLATVAPGTTLYPGYSDAWWRLKPDQPARTVKENHGGVFIHYRHNRVLTPRELARLQTFPDSFSFAGTKSNVLTQIGNAVPPALAKALALQLKAFLNHSV